MRIPTDALSGSPSFMIEVSRRDDGKYEATAQGVTVPPTVAETEGDAIQAHSRAIFDALCSGTAFLIDRKSDA